AARGRKATCGFHDTRMLNGTDEQMTRIGTGETEDREVVRLGGAAGEDDFVGEGVEERSGAFARVFEGLASATAGAVTAGGVGSHLGEMGTHRLPDGRQHRGAGVVVEIDVVHRMRIQRLAAGDGRQLKSSSRFLPSAFPHSTSGPA